MNWQSREDERVARALDGALPAHGDAAGVVALAERIRDLPADAHLDADQEFRDALRARLLTAGAALLPRPRVPADETAALDLPDPVPDTGPGRHATDPATHPGAGSPVDPGAGSGFDPGAGSGFDQGVDFDADAGRHATAGEAAGREAAGPDPAGETAGRDPAGRYPAGETAGRDPAGQDSAGRDAGSGARRARHAAAGPPARRNGRSRRRRRVAAAGALVVATLSVSTVAASGGALPGDPLYGVKRTVQGVEVVLARGDVDRGRAHLELARTRLRELDTAGVSAAPGPLVTTLDDMDAQTRTGMRLLSGVAIRRTDETRLTELDSWATHQRTLLAAAQSRLPADVRPRAARSLALLGTLLVRLDQLRAALECHCATATPVTDLQPLPGVPTAVPPAGPTGSAGSPAGPAPTAGTGPGDSVPRPGPGGQAAPAPVPAQPGPSAGSGPGPDPGQPAPTTPAPPEQSAPASPEPTTEPPSEPSVPGVVTGVLDGVLGALGGLGG